MVGIVSKEPLHIARRRLNPLLRLIFGQYSTFRSSQCIPQGYRYGHTDNLGMMLFITVGFWFGLRVVLWPLSADIAITFSASGHPGVVLCPVRDCRSGHFPSYSVVTAGKFGCRRYSMVFALCLEVVQCPANIMSVATLWKA